MTELKFQRADPKYNRLFVIDVKSSKIVLLLSTGVILTLRPHRQRSLVRVQVFHSITVVC